MLRAAISEEQMRWGRSQRKRSAVCYCHDKGGQQMRVCVGGVGWARGGAVWWVPWHATHHTPTTPFPHHFRAMMGVVGGGGEASVVRMTGG